MSLQEAFANLTPEQKEKFKGVKNQRALDAFLSDSDPIGKLTAGAAGGRKTELSDDALEAVSGGGGSYFYNDPNGSIVFNCSNPNVSAADFLKFLKPTAEDVCPHAPDGHIMCYACPDFSMT